MNYETLSKNLSLKVRQEGEKFAHVKDTLYLCIRFEGRRISVRSAPNNCSIDRKPKRDAAASLMKNE